MLRAGDVVENTACNDGVVTTSPPFTAYILRWQFCVPLYHSSFGIFDVRGNYKLIVSVRFQCEYLPVHPVLLTLDINIQLCVRLCVLALYGAVGHALSTGRAMYSAN